jgi:hypothetical protein
MKLKKYLFASLLANIVLLGVVYLLTAMFNQLPDRTSAAVVYPKNFPAMTVPAKP